MQVLKSVPWTWKRIWNLDPEKLNSQNNKKTSPENQSFMPHKWHGENYCEHKRNWTILIDAVYTPYTLYHNAIPHSFLSWGVPVCLAGCYNPRTFPSKWNCIYDCGPLASLVSCAPVTFLFSFESAMSMLLQHECIYLHSASHQDISLHVSMCVCVHVTYDIYIA